MAGTFEGLTDLEWSQSALSATLSFDAAAFLGGHLLAVAMVGGGLVVLAALIWLPKWQAARPELTPQARFEVENEARKALAEIIGGAAVLAGLLFTWENLRATQENLKITQDMAIKSHELTREGQLTDRFTKAIDQLGAVNDKGEKQLEIRLGGIYALERIARDSKRDHWPIMEVLTAYVREHAPWPSTPPKDTPPPQEHSTPEGNPAAAPALLPKLATDIQAVLTVLGRRDRTNEMEEQHLELRGTDLHYAQLGNASLERVILWSARLEGAILVDARLESAILVDTRLEGANLTRARLERASLVDTRLEGAIHLTVEQLATVKTLYGAHLDPPLPEQIRQQYPHLLEEPKW
jgi:Pentapeptide repeats (8 copies)